MANDLYPVSESDIKKLSGKKTKAKKFRGVTSKGEDAAIYDIKKNISNRYNKVNQHLINKLKD